MVLDNIGLKNFRCHEDYFLEFDGQTTQILGPNGWGKTAVIEAIYLALRGKSFKSADREMVRRGTDFYRVELNFLSGDRTVVVYDRLENKRGFITGDTKKTRLAKQDRYPIVLFEPGDLMLLVGSPSRRRKYFDEMMQQMSEGFAEAQARYDKALKQRNELLKAEVCLGENLVVWDIMLAKYGIAIREMRRKLVAMLNAQLTGVYRGIAENQDRVSVEFLSFTGNAMENEYRRCLEVDFEHDRAVGHTNFGVHKDDFLVMFNDAEADGSASRGEVRSIILALKFIEAEILTQTLRRKPVVLLDDVFSELDEKRQNALVKNFQENQVILTSVGLKNNEVEPDLRLLGL